MLQLPKRSFASRHPDPFDTMSDEEIAAYQRRVEEFNLQRSADRRLISEKSGLRPRRKRTASDVPMKEGSERGDRVARLLTRIKSELLSIEPDPFHELLTSSLEKRMRADRSEADWVGWIFGRSLKMPKPNRYFCKSVCRRYGISKSRD